MLLSDNFKLTTDLLESNIKHQMGLGNVVKGFIFCNPCNPLGVVYPMELTLALMEICRKYKVHFISDEIYALSVYGKDQTFDSVLSIPIEKVWTAYYLLI